MYARVLLLLLAGNLLLSLWYLISPSPSGSEQQPSEISKISLINKRELDLIVVRPSAHRLPSMPEIRAADLVGSSEMLAGGASQCFMLGPFDSEEQLVDWMGDISVEFNVTLERVQDTDSPYYRAFTPALDNRASALNMLDFVRDAILRSGAMIDSYVVSSGPLENAISLGLFSELLNALNVQRILEAQSINVMVEPELRFQNQYWVVTKNEYYADIKRKIDSVPAVLSRDVSVVENLCETIAQAE